MTADATASTPEELSYTREHEWVRSGDTAYRVGITDYAQHALGDVVFVSLPEVGAAVRAGEPMGEVESTKSVSDIYAPVTGQVTARNDGLDARPELVNTDPYGEGWLVEITVEGDAAGGAALLDAAAYRALVAGM
jgi:glycine cleavage system H protein